AGRRRAGARPLRLLDSPRYAWPLLAASARACAAAIASAAAAADHGLAERARHLLDRLRARLEPEPVRGYRRGMLDHRGEVKQDAADVSNRLTGREVVSGGDAGDLQACLGGHRHVEQPAELRLGLEDGEDPFQ